MRDIRTVDLNLLKAFDALLQERNVTKAAQRLSVTQPAMSAMLNRLRDSFGDPLFVRVQHGIEPTARALALMPSVKTILAEVNRMLRPVEFNPQTAEMTINIASTDYGLEAIGTPFLAHLKQLAPKIRVAFLPAQDVDLLAQFEQARIDIALVSTQYIPADLHSKPLLTEHYVCVMRADHPMANQPLNLDNFCELDFAMMSYDGGQFYGVCDEALAKLGKARRVSVSVNHFSLLPNILRSTDVVALVPSRLSHNFSGLICKELPLEVQGFAIQMAWHERTHQDPAYQWLRNLLVESLTKQ